ncbi:MAG: cytochrome c [Rhodospirillaceae bacterium]|nr:cytochrome c [Rhodospirillaceae bacterium]
MERILMRKKWRSRAFYLALLAAVLISWGIYAWQSDTPSANSGEAVTLVLPSFSKPALAGQEIFTDNCASCHGPNGSGSDQGPPLIHDIYNPGHHADAAFYRAVQAGVRQHHWPFGNMPAQPKVSQDQVTAILEFIRELQEANGIFYREHHM